jgi:hypothetical protein
MQQLPLRPQTEIFSTLKHSPQVTHLTIFPAQLLKYALAQRVFRALTAGLQRLPQPLRSLTLDITALPEAADLPEPAAWLALTQLRMLDSGFQQGKICK